MNGTREKKVFKRIEVLLVAIFFVAGILCLQRGGGAGAELKRKLLK